MPQSTLSYVLSNIRQEIPATLLEMAFKPTKYNTTIEQRIVSEIVEGPILLDTNLVGGKRREIILNSSWEIDLKPVAEWNAVGTGVQGSYYLVPEEAREYRNISSVVGVTPSMVSSLPGSSINYNGTGSFGNTASGMMSQMLGTYTFGQYPITPQVTLEGTNIIRFHPRQLIDGCAVTVFLEFDSEFLNLSVSAILSLSDLCLCATKRYIANQLRVSIDETEIVAGMEIGIIKDLVSEYADAGKEYHEKLIRLKGSLSFDARSLSRLIYHAL